MDIYWIKDKTRYGPKPEVEIVSMLQNEEIFPETLAWHKGCEGWIPLTDLPALTSYFKKPEPPLYNKDGEEIPAYGGGGVSEGEVKVILMPRPSPYARLFARLADSVLYYLLALIAVCLFAAKPVDVFFNTSDQLTILVPWIFLEAIMLRFWGTTPGKRLFGIRIYSLYNSAEWKEGAKVSASPGVNDGQKTGRLTFLQAFGRSVQVMILGMGLNIAMFTILTWSFSFFILRRTGTTLWDNAAKTVEIQEPAKSGDWFFYMALFFGLFIIFLYVAGDMPAEYLERYNQQLETIRSGIPNKS